MSIVMVSICKLKEYYICPILLKGIPVRNVLLEIWVIGIKALKFLAIFSPF